MSIETYYNKTGYVVTRTVTSTNKYGESTFSEDESTSFICNLQPQGGNYAVTIQGKVIQVTHNLYCATTVDVSVGDEIKIDSIKYRVLAILDECSKGNHYKVLLEGIF